MPEPTPGAHNAERARRVLEELEVRRLPSAGDLDQLVHHVLSLSRRELADRGRLLIGRWRDAGCQDPDLDLAQTLLTVSVPSAAARHRLDALTSSDAQVAALEVANCVFRGELQPAIDLAQAHGWFLDTVEGSTGLTYALWALAMSCQFDEAQAVVDAWKRRHAQAAPDRYQLMLRFESRIAYYTHQFARELGLLQDAYALCGAFDLDATRDFMEPDLAAALCRCEDHEGAHRIIDAWPQPRSEGPLAGYRNGVRLEVALMEGRYDDAMEAGQRYLRFTEEIKSAPLECLARFGLAMAAPPVEFGDRLAAFRAVTHRYQIPLFLLRLPVLEHVAAAGHDSMRDAAITVQMRGTAERHPLLRVWTPRLSWSRADLYWDRVRGVLLLRGSGPHRLSSKPVLLRFFEAIMSRPGFTAEVAVLFDAVWGGPYDPLTHEGKVHVTTHRLRRWLDRCSPGAGQLLEARDGQVGVVEDATVCVIGLSAGGAQAAGPPATGVQDRIFQCLEGGQEMAPRELLRRLGISRSALNQALRHLLADGRILRVGQGRSTRYRNHL